MSRYSESWYVPRKYDPVERDEAFARLVRRMEEDLPEPIRRLIEADRQRQPTAPEENGT